MINETTILVFGYNQYAQEIARSVTNEFTVKHFAPAEEIDEERAKEEGIELIDLSDEWDAAIEVEESIAFCALGDEAQNLFLTISLRSRFEDLVIVAIAVNKEGVNKLKMAGANKVIAIEETTAEIISDIIHKPVISRVLNDILYSESELKIAQIEIENEAIFNEESTYDIDWGRYRGIVVLSVMHPDLKSEFIYSAKTKKLRLKRGDMLIVVGYENDIAAFEKLVGSRRYVNWRDWSRQMG